MSSLTSLIRRSVADYRLTRGEQESIRRAFIRDLPTRLSETSNQGTAPYLLRNEDIALLRQARTIVGGSDAFSRSLIHEAREYFMDHLNTGLQGVEDHYPSDTRPAPRLVAPVGTYRAPRIEY